MSSVGDVALIISAVGALVLTGCSSGAQSLAPISSEEAVAQHVEQSYGYSDGRLPNCFAPVDWGTAQWDSIVGPDESCERRKIVEVRQEDSGAWCVFEAHQSSYKWSDAEGFNVDPVTVTRYCYELSRSSEGMSIMAREVLRGSVWSNYLGGQDVGTMPNWPE